MSAVLEPTADAGPVWLQSLQRSREEWRANPRLRWGVWLIVGMFLLWLLLLVQDQADAWRAETETARAELDRLRPIQNSGPLWNQRSDDAHLHMEAARSMLWVAPSPGLVEAGLQDTLRSLAEKSGVTVRELAILSGAERKPGPTQAIRARLVVEYNQRLALMGLLSEMGRSPKLMMVDSLKFRPQSQPPRAELEIRVLHETAEAKP